MPDRDAPIPPAHAVIASAAVRPTPGRRAQCAQAHRPTRRSCALAGLSPDLCPLDGRRGDAARTCASAGRGQLRRAHALARALVIALERLHERTLAGSRAFEIATRARQGGVPAYAVTAENALDAFDARILDLQLITQARSAKALTAAGRRLAEL